MAGGAQDSAEEGIVGINVTPLVDIVLVLLIIFMVTAKLIVSKQLPLDLPKAASGSEVQTVFSVVLLSDNTIQVDSKPVPNDDALLPLARAARDKTGPDLRAVIKADSSVTHGRVIHVLDLLKQANIAKIAFGVSPVAPVAPGGGGGAPAPAPPK